jgi:signal transduction histidine kinase/CheY-like chemotaxis protein
MVAPIAELRRGVLRFGSGDLAHRIEVASGDELEDLATQFNAMAAQLRQIYADLERRVAERTRDLDVANQAKSRFLAAASQDLRQPMHALAMFVGQLNVSCTPAERAVLTKRIEAAVGSLSELLDQLLDLSKLDAGAVQVTQQAFAIGDTLNAIETHFAPLAHAKGIELRVRISRTSLRSDPVLVHRILLNLVANAIRYTERGGVLVGCRTRGERLRIAVWDTGRGIPHERRDDVFREFVQLGSHDPRLAGQSGGLGLGLAIVARLADLLGARIELRSTVGRGSMFAFELPLGAKSELRPQPLAAPLWITSLRGVFVLVVDDDEVVRGATCGLLESWGCLTLAAASGDDAIVQLSAHDRPPELIICDYRLEAGENGVDTLARVRSAIQDFVPAIILTADVSAVVLSAAQAIGAPLLHKPVSPVKLRALLTQVLLRGSAGERVPA